MPSPLISMFNAGIAAVSGRESVIRAFKHERKFMPDMIIAVGKAASEMCLGAQAVFGDTIPAVVATKHQHCHPGLMKNPAVTTIESGHPIADRKSLLAGKILLNAVGSLGADSELLLLVSGGASAIAECLPEHIGLKAWQELNSTMIASSQKIAEINEKRKSLSLIKDGRLLESFHGKRVISCAISDVQGDSFSVIGSGIGDVNRCAACHEFRLLASNQMAREAVAEQAKKLGYTVKHNDETLYDDVFILSGRLGSILRTATPGVYIWGGEPTLTLPDQPGNGGRNQSLALALAGEISGQQGIQVLVAGTDGTDGPTDAAGGLIDGATFSHPDQAQIALEMANAGDYLNKYGGRFVTGPTGTNVMDLVIAIIG